MSKSCTTGVQGNKIYIEETYAKTMTSYLSSTYLDLSFYATLTAIIN